MVLRQTSEQSRRTSLLLWLFRFWLMRVSVLWLKVQVPVCFGPDCVLVSSSISGVRVRLDFGTISYLSDINLLFSFQYLY
ncbi:hypothetical protein Hanom_Chr09g00849941 [Helianthus anomalus]